MKTQKTEHVAQHRVFVLHQITGKRDEERNGLGDEKNPMDLKTDYIRWRGIVKCSEFIKRINY